MKAGFTAPELLVVIGVIMILSLITIPYYSVAKQQLAVQRSASNLAQNIRLIMEGSMSVREEEFCEGFLNYKHGYGVILEENTPGEYKLFADCNGNRVYNQNPDELIAQGRIEFEDGVEIGTLSRSPLNIVFEPPDPTVTISNGDDTATITLKSVQYPEKTRTIIINKVGLIDIN